MLKKIAIILMLVLFLLGGVAGVALAANDESNITLPTEATHKGLYVKAGDTVSIDGTIEGDAWLAGSNITINGSVNGSLYAAGSNIVVKGKVNGNVMAAGSRVTIENEVGGSAYLAGSDLVVGKDAKVDGSMVAFGSRYEQSGSVGTQLYLFGSEVFINGDVGSTAKIYASSIVVGRDAHISGDLQYVSDARTQIENDRNIAGSITKITEPSQSKPFSLASSLLGALLGLAGSLLLGLLVISFLPGSARSTAQWLQQNTPKSVLFGLGFAVVVPVGLIVAAITIVGLPLAIFGLLVYLAVMMLGEIITGFCIGRWLVKRDNSKLGSIFLQLLVGLGLLKLVGIVPIVGGIVGFFAVVAGVGALVLRSWYRVQTFRGKQVAKY